ncbi:MAG: methyltransferase domain-containing protein [Desulfobaccales bacterium]
MDQGFWEKYFLTYDLLNEVIPYQELMNDLISVLEVEKGDLIFDAGSGTGNLSLLLKAYGAKPTGYDFSEKAIKIHLMKDRDAEVYFGDLTNKLPFPDNYFDKVVSNNVIYTIDRGIRLSLFEEIYRVLKIKGKFVIANVHTGFNPLVIFKDHLKHSLKTKRMIKTAIDIITKGNAIWKLFYYSYIIIRNDKVGRYAFVDKNEQRHLLTQAGFRNISGTISAYSNQSYIDAGIK